MKLTVAHFVTFNLYLSGQLVRLALKAVTQNGRDFMEIFLLHALAPQPSRREHFDKNARLVCFLS
jgi:hypothetical protein